MTEELKTRIAKEAEEKYPLYSDDEIDNTPYELDRHQMVRANTEAKTQRESHISAATLWAERLEAVRDEVAKAYRNQDNTNDMAVMFEALSIIDKQLNP